MAASNNGRDPITGLNLVHVTDSGARTVTELLRDHEAAGPLHHPILRALATAEMALANISGKRLTYRRLDA
jgi:hypothetical protein